MPGTAHPGQDRELQQSTGPGSPPHVCWAGSPVAGLLVDQTDAQQRCRLHQMRQLQLRVCGRVPATQAFVSPAAAEQCCKAPCQDPLAGMRSGGARQAGPACSRRPCGCSRQLSPADPGGQHSVCDRKLSDSFRRCKPFTTHACSGPGSLAETPIWGSSSGHLHTHSGRPHSLGRPHASTIAAYPQTGTQATSIQHRQLSSKAALLKHLSHRSSADLAGTWRKSILEVGPSMVPRLATATPSKTPTMVASCSWLKHMYRSVALRQSSWPATGPRRSALTLLPTTQTQHNDYGAHGIRLISGPDKRSRLDPGTAVIQWALTWRLSPLAA